MNVVDDLVRRSIQDGDAIGKVIYPEHMSFERACLICARAIDEAVENYTYDRYMENEQPVEIVTDIMVEAAFKKLLNQAWDERGKKDQFELGLAESMWRGNAAHEARKDLE